jgi:hypothetical protein
MIARSLSVAAILALFSLVSEANAERRIALVVGNSAYQNVAQLDIPKNNASLMAHTLKELEFTFIRDGAQLKLDKAVAFGVESITSRAACNEISDPR